MEEKKLKKIPYNIPIIQNLPREVIADTAFLNHQGKTCLQSAPDPDKPERNAFDLTLPSFLPIENMYVSPAERQRATEIRKFESWAVRANSEERKSILKDILLKNINVEDVLKEEIKHTHPTFEPWEHQALDAYALKYSLNMLLTHEVRVGKTITATLGAYNNPFAKRILILCPKIVVYDAWVKTFTQWTDLKVATYLSETSKKKKEKRDADFEAWKRGEIDVLVCNIDFFVLNYKKRFRDLKEDEREDLLIIDEGHFLSNRQQTTRQNLSSTRSLSILDYRVRATKSFCWILTGTPARNSEHEILSLFYILNPIKTKNKNGSFTINPKTGFAVDNYNEFFRRFARLSQIPSPSNGYRFEIETNYEYDTALEELNLLHRLHRNQKDLWGDPEKYNTYTDVTVEANRSQNKAYKLIKTNGDEYFDFESPLVRDIFLRQIAVDHRLLKNKLVENLRELVEHEDKEYREAEFYDITGRNFDEVDNPLNLLIEEVSKDYAFDKKGAKAEWAIEWIKENKERIQGNKLPDSVNLKGIALDSEEFRTKQLQGRQPVVMFSFFKSFLHIFAKDLKEVFGDDLIVQVIDGSIVGEERQKIVDRFQNGEIDILLAQTIAMSEGVTLNRGDEAIFFDRVWENVKMEQVKARIHNPSKPYPKNEIFLMLEDSIDAKVAESNQIKADNVQYVNKEIINVASGAVQDIVNEFFRNFMKKK